MFEHNIDLTRLPVSWFFMVGIMVVVGLSLVTSYEPPMRSNVPQVCMTKGC